MLKPQRATPNTPVKAEHINSHARAIEEIQSRIDTFVPNTKPPFVPGKIPPPFHVSFTTGGTKEAPTYKASVYYGRVCDRIPGTSDALKYYEPHNLKWGEDGAAQDPPQPADSFRTFGITVGQQISIVVYTNNLGKIGGSAAPEKGPVEITVGAENLHDSTHYRPPAGDDDYGSEGIYYYKLAVLRAATDRRPVYLEKFLSGSNIDNWHELPNVDNLDNTGTTGTARVLKRIDPGNGKYELRTLVEFDSELEYGVDVVEEGDKIKLDTKGGNLNLTIATRYLMFSEDSGGYVINTEVATTEVLYFRKGLLCPSNPGDTPADLMEKFVTYLADPL